MRDMAMATTYGLTVQDIEECEGLKAREPWEREQCDATIQPVSRWKTGERLVWPAERCGRPAIKAVQCELGSACDRGGWMPVCGECLMAALGPMVLQEQQQS